ncbi:MAG: histidine phosphatase family protein [Rhizobiales bacterium]|nr:histidine phosphatase family protein [Hyphomicrobiales bacterium]
MAAGTPTQVAPTLGYEAIQDLTRTIPFRPRLTRFIFLRHGETEGNRKGIYQAADVPLNAAGEAQAAEAADRLALASIAHVAASPMMRAWRTAAIVTDGRGLTPEPDGGLAERYFLGLVGTTVGRMDWRDDPPACETLAAFVHRSGNCLSRWLSQEDNADGDLMLVSHGGLLLVLAALTGVDLNVELRRNATPILFTRSTAGWEAVAVS